MPTWQTVCPISMFIVKILNQILMCLIFSCHISNYLAKKGHIFFLKYLFLYQFFYFPKKKKKKTKHFSNLHTQVLVTYIKNCKNLIYDYDQIQVIFIPVMNSIHLFL